MLCIRTPRHFIAGSYLFKLANRSLLSTWQFLHLSMAAAILVLCSAYLLASLDVRLSPDFVSASPELRKAPA